MLAVLLALLAAAAGLPPRGAVATETAAQRVEAAGPADDCCGEIVSGSPTDPCPPGEPCPPTGGCCACVSCGKRVADAPPLDRPVEAEGDTRDGAPSQRPTGIEEVDAVWHPPQG